MGAKCHRAADDATSPLSTARSFIVNQDAFFKDGEKFLLRSGSIHYSRVHPAYWRDRIQRMKALGLNAITTYAPWNFHEEQEGSFDFSLWRDVTAFLEIAHDEGMLVYFRPGPYICGEWEMGGLPAWLLQKDGIKLRTYEDQYVQAVDAWWGELLPKLKPHLYSHGGPIVMVQLENEYGYFGNCGENKEDAEYMEHLLRLAYQHLGHNVVYTTCDGPMVLHKASPWKNDKRVVATIDGSLKASYALDFVQQKAFNASGNSPKMWSELWTGWFTSWGQKEASTMSALWHGFGVWAMMQEEASFNLYMAHGGTNFGFFSGANSQDNNGMSKPVYMPDITSYDYNAPISENGDNGDGKFGGNIYSHVKDSIEGKSFLHEVYVDIQQQFEKFAAHLAPWQAEKSLPDEHHVGPPRIPRTSYGIVHLNEVATLFGNLELLVAYSKEVEAGAKLPNMEALHQNYGLILYRCSETPFLATQLHFEEETLHDRVQIFVDGQEVGTAYRVDCPTSVSVPRGSSMDLLVENMGRTNFSQRIFDCKGLLQEPPVVGKWTAHSLPLLQAQVQALPFTKVGAAPRGPVFRRGTLHIEGEPQDTYFDTRGLVKGYLWINGFNLGRYWESAGPQHALYVPAPLLCSGANELIILEFHDANAKTILSTSEPRWTAV